MDCHIRSSLQAGSETGRRHKTCLWSLCLVFPLHESWLWGRFCCLGNFLCSVRYLKKLDKGFVLMYEMLKWFFFSESWSMFEHFEHCSTGYRNMFGKCYLCTVAFLSICCFHFLLSSNTWQYLIDRKSSECESAVLKFLHQESCGLNPH